MRDNRRHNSPIARLVRLILSPICLVPVVVSIAGCMGNPDRQTLAQLRAREPDLEEVEIDDGIDQAIAGYRKFLEEAPKSTLTPEAMRRLADLKLEKEYGALETPIASEARPAALPQPAQVDRAKVTSREPRRYAASEQMNASTESDGEFERRASGVDIGAYLDESTTTPLPSTESDPTGGPLEAIALYDEILEAYPNYAQNDQVLYQKARAYDELGRVDEAVAVAALLVAQYPESRHLDEIQFRRAEYFFTRKKFFDAEEAYTAIVDHGPRSEYYELALYKLGWTFYKQMMLDEAIRSYIKLLDHKVSIAYDFDQTEDEAEEQRIADTYRVISLCFSDLGGAETITTFFSEHGNRSYEDRVYRHLGEFYLEKLRYNDAATAYEAFIDLYPIHRSSPYFSMRVVEIYEAGNFPKLVLDSKKAFAASYGLDSEYWQHFSPEDVPEVLSYLKGNLEDLANHYHALYQSTDRPEDKPAHFAESALWYRAYLSSFPAEPETPQINYQLADLLLENEDFREAAREYEHIAYDYAEHERSASAGYAAIFAHREHEKQVDDAEPVRREAVASTLRFVDHYPEHEHAAAVLGAAVDDLYGLHEYAEAIATGRRLIEQFPTSESLIRRAAWTVIAHASFDTEKYDSAELAYVQVLELTAPEGESAAEIVNNLAAAIYKQGELANQGSEYQAAADHFLRIAKAAPGSDIRPNAEYDAGAALIKLEDWSRAASVLESFRHSFPEHELNREATRQLALVYREDGNPARAAEEYERVAAEADDSELRREALLVAGDLYDEAALFPNALNVYRSYVIEFTTPLEPTVATHFKMAEIYEKTGEQGLRKKELQTIVSIDRGAGEARTDAIRVFAARSALVLSEEDFRHFVEAELKQPFEESLQEKQRRMDRALAALGQLVDYEVGEVTAAATFYIAEVYAEFSRALLESERPSDLAAADLADYEMVLEENAYPFEEKSIDVHEKNLELISAGVFNVWIEKSLARLAIAMPGRYAKFEASSGFLQSIKTYSYQAPISPTAITLASVPAESGPQEEIAPPRASTDFTTSDVATSDVVTTDAVTTEGTAETSAETASGEISPELEGESAPAMNADLEMEPDPVEPDSAVPAAPANALFDASSNEAEGASHAD